MMMNRDLVVPVARFPLEPPLPALRLPPASRPFLSAPGAHLGHRARQRAAATAAMPDRQVAPAAVASSATAGGWGKGLSKENKLWGGRFEESVTDAVERFSESVSFDRALYKQDIMGSRAHAAMLAEQGLITIIDKDRILKGLDEIERSIEAGEFSWRIDREDVHMNIEAALTDLIGESAKKLHTARSRNDQVVTDLRLWCRDAIDDILMHLKHLQVALVNLALKNEGLIVPGYTHLQRAQPVLLQHLLLSYVEQVFLSTGL
uniref:Argininosuccinate lyase n=1 Tax=Anthurium amnicola TaxID=1678845 RepID=A0A1D1XIQ9_9ARAE